MADPPRVRSSAVAENVTGRAAPGGSGVTRTLPAHSIGPSVSPLGRATVKVASVTSAPETEAVPSSWAVMRRRCQPLLVVATRFYLYAHWDRESVCLSFHYWRRSAPRPWKAVAD